MSGQVDELEDADAEAAGSAGRPCTRLLIGWSMDELQAAVRSLAFEVKTAELKKMVGTISNGTDFAEFLAMMTGKMGEKDSREDIEKVFKLFDDDNTSRISFRNLARVAEELGENIDDE